MTFFTTVTQKGQITLPKTLRELLGIGFYDKVKITVNEKEHTITIEPTHDLLDIAGKYKEKMKGKDILTLREKLETEYKRV